METHILLSAVTKSEPAKQELTQQKTGDKNFSLSIASKKISETSVEEVKEVLRYAMVLVGLREHNWPVDKEKELLINHVFKNFGGHTLAEVKLAFDMAVNRKLTMGEGETVVCYENFSCLYFSCIMNAYRKWAESEYRNIKEPPPVQKIYSDEEILNERRAEIEAAFQAMKKGYYPLVHSYFKEVLHEDKLLKEGETVGEFFVRHINVQSQNIYIKQ